MNNLEILRDKLSREITEFRHSYNNMESIRIYNDFYIIGFYEEHYEMIMSDFIDDWFNDEELEWLCGFKNPLSFLYNEWLSCDGVFSHSWEDMIYWIQNIYREEKYNG